MLFNLIILYVLIYLNNQNHYLIKPHNKYETYDRSKR
jgi:hypothetical protein